MLEAHWRAASAPAKEPKSRPFSIRLTDSERRLLLAKAGRKPLGVFIRDVILDEGTQAKRPRLVNPVKDHQVLARVLAALGQSRIANNLNQLAKAANMGALPVSPEVESDLTEACRAVQAIRADLMRALGSSGSP